MPHQVRLTRFLECLPLNLGPEFCFSFGHVLRELRLISEPVLGSPALKGASLIDEALQLQRVTGTVGAQNPEARLCDGVLVARVRNLLQGFV
ncbi:hypothetical protein [Deinococcus peraridilitoris]|uniref:Uncharacterized protein n=1 Tax=Deinococcus peraridilitoris (strain DSM 19664 / LMG 22246 / CIP 109416 / KR-200) TaxID=937777 RepID=L0A3W5_DEIPD|nr:hypothetical protein [Deinococcus peraridilitoris]AFZ68541.1 hypothetical protein Deipe_3094 [Deinococcus peraridilitoris DSM 19664]